MTLQRSESDGTLVRCGGTERWLPGLQPNERKKGDPATADGGVSLPRFLARFLQIGRGNLPGVHLGPALVPNPTSIAKQ